uniref:Cytochrome P450 1A1 n=1 Tax=Plectus sambesii TaxID=2011161 RepID=A0A914XCE0_9BILA
MFAWTIVQLAALFWIIYYVWRKLLASRRSTLPQPPGPYGLPILGYMPFLGKRPHVTLKNLAEKYGDIFQLQIGGQKTVVLGSIDFIREAYSKDVFAGRPSTLSIKAVLESGPSRFAFRTANAKWKFLRKVSLKALSLVASSRNSRLEAVVDEATEGLEAELTAANGQPFDPQRNIFDCVASVIGSALFGSDFNTKDELLKPVLQLPDRLASFFAVGNLLDTLPFGSVIMRKKIKDFLEAITPVNQVTEKYIREHVVHCEQEDDIRDVADALAMVAKQTPLDLKQQIGLNDDAIRCSATDLFGAGFATTMETVRWAVNLLAVSPDVQAKARLELEQVCGDRPVQLTDRSSIPYNEAMLIEILRFSSLAPLGLPHSTMDDTTLHGYFIPKNTTILANFYGHHRNAKLFPEPESFKPERFLTNDGSLNMDATQLVIPFSVGKRRCVGENLARQELALIIGRLLQK